MATIEFHIVSLYGRSPPRAIEFIVSNPEQVLGNFADAAAFFATFLRQNAVSQARYLHRRFVGKERPIG
jgi:hypothetical protein